MLFFPFHKFSIVSSKSVDEIKNILKENSAILTPFDYNFDKIFVGSVSNNGFKLRLKISNMNTFNPIAIGEFLENENGSIIKIKIRTHIFFTIVSLVITLISIYFLLKAIFGNVTFNEWSIFGSIIPYIMIIIGFNSELNNLKNKLSKYLK
jgi:hypothetical protein